MSESSGKDLVEEVGEEAFDGNDIENNEKKVYEESLDLDLSNARKKIWLVRLPK